jgi:hypothetical protein
MSPLTPGASLLTVSLIFSVAKRVRSQPMAASSCEQNWATLDVFQSKKRSRLGKETINQMVFHKANYMTT